MTINYLSSEALYIYVCAYSTFKTAVLMYILAYICGHAINNGDYY